MKGSDFSFDNRRRERVGIRLLIRYPSILWPLRSKVYATIYGMVGKEHVSTFIAGPRLSCS